MLSVGRPTLRFIRAVIYTGAALVGAGVTFIGLAELPLPRSSTAASLALVVGGIWVVIWSSNGARMRVSLRQRQIRRASAAGRFRGPGTFGFLVGLGWWTVVTTPFFWIGLISTVLGGHALLGAIVFGTGRSVSAWYGAVQGPQSDASSHVRLLVFRAGPFFLFLSPIVAVAAGVTGAVIFGTSV